MGVVTHLLVVVDTGRDGLNAAPYAASVAAELGCELTVALLIERPWTLALMPYDLGRVPDDDAEIDAVIWLTRVLDPYGVRWRLEPVTEQPVRTIRRITSSRPARLLVVGRRRWLPGWHRASRVAGELGLPVLAVPSTWRA